jgi:hypothetical protein
MFRFAKYTVVLGLLLVLGRASFASADVGADREQAARLSASLPGLVVSENYRALSEATMQLAGAQNRLGDTPAACRALSQSLESYRVALVKQTGVSEGAASSVNDDSDGMAAVRTRFGCAHI